MIDSVATSQAFDTVELNASFYRWPRTATFASWRRRLPEGFQLTVKAPRGLTHAKRLYAPEAWVDRICAAWHELYDRRGVLLVQLHPRHERDDARLAYFLSRFPWWVRIAVEFRHPSWVDDRVFSISDRSRRGLLRDERSAACRACCGRPRRGCTCGCTDPIMIISTAARTAMMILVGGRTRIREWQATGNEVYAYFNNDGGGNAVRNAQTLRGMINAGR